MELHEEIISQLIEFGLEKTDALLYVGLLQTGTTTVNTVSTKLGIEKGKIYRSLHRLQNLGLVSSTLSSPAMIQALQPEKALKTLIEHKEEQITCMYKILKKLSENITQFKRPEEEVSQIPSFYIIQGRSNVYYRIGKIIESSSGVVYIVTTVQDLLRMSYTAIPDKIKLFSRDGATVRIIIDENDQNSIGEIDLYNAQVRRGKLASASRMIVSHKNRLMMSGSVSKSAGLNDETDSALYTNSSELIQNIFDYCEHLWSVSKPLATKLATNYWDKNK